MCDKDIFIEYKLLYCMIFDLYVFDPRMPNVVFCQDGSCGIVAKNGSWLGGQELEGVEEFSEEGDFPCCFM